MKVSIDDLDVDMQLGNNGVRFAIYGNDGEYMGKLRVGKPRSSGAKAKWQSATASRLTGMTWSHSSRLSPRSRCTPAQERFIEIVDNSSSLIRWARGLPALGYRLVLACQLFEEWTQAAFFAERPAILAAEVQVVATPFPVVPPLLKTDLGGGHGGSETADRRLGNRQQDTPLFAAAYPPVRKDRRKNDPTSQVLSTRLPLVSSNLNSDHPAWDDIRVRRITCSAASNHRCFLLVGMEEGSFSGTIEEQAMTQSLRTLLVATTLGVFVSFALSGDDSPKKEPVQPAAKGNDDVFDHQRFCVTIWPAKTQVRPGEEFEVKLRVVNSSKESQSIKVASCSWDQHWKWSNRQFTYKPWACYRNAIVAVQLQPGEAYENVLVMRFTGGPSKTESLRMGFTPAGEKKTYWSNEVVLGVK